MKLQFRLTLFLWAIFIILSTTFWIFKNNLPPSWDQANYLGASEILRQTFVGHGFFSFLAQTTTILGSKAPLITILPVPLYLIFGSSPHVALTLNLIFLFLFYIFFFKLVKLVFDEKTALIASVIISTMPLFYGLARYFFVEFGLMTLIVIWMYLILKTEYLSNRKYLFLLGIVSGLGILMKFHFFIFVGGSAFVVAYNSWENLKGKIFGIKNILIFTIPTAIIALPWYLRNILTVLWKAKRSTNTQLLGNLYYGPPFSINNLYLSGLDFINYVISAYWFFVFVTIAIVFIAGRKKIKINYFLLLWFLVPFLIFYLGPNKDYRLMLPLLPPLAILVAWLISKIFAQKYLMTATIVLTLFPTIIYLNTAIFNAKIISHKISLGQLLIADQRIGDYVVPAKSEEWPIKETLSFIAKHNPSGLYQTVISASEDEAFNINGLQYTAVLNKLPLKIGSSSYFPRGTNYETIRKTIEGGNYLMMKIGGQAGPTGLNNFNNQILNNLDNKVWQEIPNDIKLPDGGKIKIWQKIS